MKNSISLNIRENLFNETEKLRRQLNMARTAYINEAIKYFNEANRRDLIKKRLEFESKLVSKESKKILKEMEMLEENESSID